MVLIAHRAAEPRWRDVPVHVEVIQQPRRLLAHLFQVIRNPGDAAVRVLVGGIVPVLKWRLAPAAIHIHPGEEHPRPAGGHRSGDQGGGVHGFHRRRPFDIARQHVVVAGRRRIDIRVVAVPPFRLVIHAPQTHAAGAGRAEGTHNVLDPLLGERRRDGNVGVIGIVGHLAAIGEDAIPAVRIVGIRRFLRAVFLHAEAAFAGGFGRPVHQRDGAETDGAGGQVGGVERVEAGADAVVFVAPQIVARVVLDAGLPVVAGGVVAAPAQHRNAHQAHQSLVAPLVDAVDERTDGMAVGVGVDGQGGRLGVQAQYGKRSCEKVRTKHHDNPSLSYSAAALRLVYTGQRVRMKSKKTPAEKGAERLAAILEPHLDQLSRANRAEKIHAFHEVVARIGTRAKSGESRPNRANRPAALKRA